MALHDDLLEQASHLTQRDRSRPRQANLRRAISTGYYALFHYLVFEATRNWKHARHHDQLARAFEHGSMKNACKQTIRELTMSLPALEGLPRTQRRSC